MRLRVSFISRELSEVARARLKSYPVLVLSGPRQSGKTTLAKQLAPQLPYFSLEDPDIRSFATEDPRGFLAQAADGAVFDEIQRCPGLFSYLQRMVDEDGRMGRFLLTGSSQFELISSITQSLAGRASMLTLLPFSLGELQKARRAPKTVDELIWSGLYPPIYDRQVDPSVWLQDYVATYLERDVRQILQIQDLAAFQRFVQLCAGRIGQLLNVSSLAADTGISRITAESWLSVLQASYLIHLVRPWSVNVSKRLIKSPKLYFCDCGLAAWLIGIRRSEHLVAHPHRGALFENWVVTECIKARLNAGLRADLHFLRDKEGHEVDVVVETAPHVIQAIEIKSGATVAGDFFAGLEYWKSKLTHQTFHSWLVYGGDASQARSKGSVVPWSGIERLLSSLSV